MVVSGENMKKMVNSGQLNLQDGEIELLDFRMAMLPAFTLTKLIENLYQRYGDEAFDILFETGKSHGQYAVDQIGRKHEIPKRQFIDQGLYTADALGLGKFSLERLNLEEGKIVYRVDDSPFKEEFNNSEILSDLDRSIDELQLGMCHTTAEAVLDGPVESEETQCIFQGDPYCRFVIKEK